MSMENISRFVEELRTNEELKEKLKALELSNEDLEGLVSLARESGFYFTADELKEISSSAAVKELLLDELDKVAGGLLGLLGNKKSNKRIG